MKGVLGEVFAQGDYDKGGCSQNETCFLFFIVKVTYQSFCDHIIYSLKILQSIVHKKKDNLVYIFKRALSLENTWTWALRKSIYRRGKK